LLRGKLFVLTAFKEEDLKEAVSQLQVREGQAGQ
jgi:hypothetical protein